jgi:hypothetical protein
MSDRGTPGHARASSVQFVIAVEEGALRLQVRDNGIRGARTDGTDGLLGLRDPAAALNGELSIESPSGAGTLIAAAIPVPAAASASARDYAARRIGRSSLRTGSACMVAPASASSEARLDWKRGS